MQVGEEVVLATLNLSEQPNCRPDLVEKFGAVINVIKNTVGYYGVEIKYNDYQGGLLVVRKRTEAEVDEYNQTEAQRNESIKKYNEQRKAKQLEQDTAAAARLGISLETYLKAKG
jgi:hypothetical protein